MSAALRVLVVDDDELVRNALSAQLGSLGVGCIDAVADGVGARKALSHNDPYDVIISDLMLPGADGVEVLRDLARTHPRTAVVLVSSMDDAVLRSVAVMSRERGLRVLGALRKPLRLDALQGLLHSLEQPADAPAATSASLPPTAEQLQQALQRGRVGARVQPKLRLTDGSLHSVEVFAHWVTDLGDEVAPGVVARLALQGHCSRALGEHMLGVALRACADWSAAGLEVPVAVNLDAQILNHLELPEFVDRLLRGGGLAPRLLIVEIAETALDRNPAILDVLSRLRLRGVRVSLDRFGSGPSSATRLMRLPVTELKFDRSFVRCLPGVSAAATFVEHGARLARSLNLEAVAVGVESEEQAAALRALGCHVGQGRHFGWPMEPEELPDWQARRGGAQP